MKIGLDVDGVLADFNPAYMKLIIDHTGVDRFGQDFVIREWNYPEEQAGYATSETAEVWNRIKADRSFWYRLDCYDKTLHAMDVASDLQAHGHDLYFITSRVGFRAKDQTECWLRGHGFKHPTVLISHDKGAAAIALDLTHYIDDRIENAMSVRVQKPSCSTVICTRTWNDQYVIPGTTRAESAFAFLTDLT